MNRPRKRPASRKAEARALSANARGGKATGAAKFPALFLRSGWPAGLLLLVMVVAAYARAYRGEFIWDDDANIINAVVLRSLAGLRRIWLEPGATQQYYPLTHTSFWLEYRLWGLNPFGYHVSNILLHAGSAILLWRILKRLGVAGAWLGAALFAVHPVCVESVAWITERKNSLAGVFYLGSLLAALRFWLPELANNAETKQAESPRLGPGRFYWVTMALFLCAMWSKTATIGLPAVILLLVWWQRRRVTAREVYLVLPLAAMAAGLGLITVWIEKNNLGAAGKEWDFSWAQRCVLAGRIFWFYLGKLAWPHPLMFAYPRWNIQAGQLLAYFPLAAMVGGIMVLWWQRKTWGRPALCATIYFLVMLLPVMGFFNVYFYRYSFVCDHFQYLACMGPLALAAAGMTVALGRFRNRVTLIVPALVLLGLGALTWRQTGVYHDRETLWRDTMAHNPDSSLAHNNFGYLLLSSGKMAEAIPEFQSALKSEPGNAEAHNNLGVAFLRQDRAEEAMAEFQAALDITPRYASARANLASALLQVGKVNEAIRNYELALEIAPDDLAAQVNLGDALFYQGRVEEGTRRYETAIKLARVAGREDVAELLQTELKRKRKP